MLGAEAAERLGIDRAGVRVWLGERWFTVVGILAPVTLAPSLDGAALVGFAAAERLFDADRSASTIYVRAEPDAIEGVRELLGRTANPEHARGGPGLAAVGRARGRARPPRPRSPRCSWASARSRCSSAASGSPT